MARISGVDIPNAKRVEVALTYIYGIGPKSASDILAKTGIDPDKRAKDLTKEDIAKLRDEIENGIISPDAFLPAGFGNRGGTTGVCFLR